MTFRSHGFNPKNTIIWSRQIEINRIICIGLDFGLCNIPINSYTINCVVIRCENAHQTNASLDQILFGRRLTVQIPKMTGIYATNLMYEFLRCGSVLNNSNKSNNDNNKNVDEDNS